MFLRPEALLCVTTGLNKKHKGGERKPSVGFSRKCVFDVVTPAPRAGTDDPIEGDAYACSAGPAGQFPAAFCSVLQDFYGRSAADINDA